MSSRTVITDIQYFMLMDEFRDDYVLNFITWPSRVKNKLKQFTVITRSVSAEQLELPFSNTGVTNRDRGTNETYL